MYPSFIAGAVNDLNTIVVYGTENRGSDDVGKETYL